ncbi:MAG: hypothetical protein AAGM84_03230 [Pseudomonadota bacterium]
MDDEDIVIEFDARVRLRVKRPAEHKQSLYFFNLYRAGSSVMEAVAEAIASVAGFAPLNIVQALDRNGVLLSDAQDYSRESVYLSGVEDLMDQMKAVPGCLHYGFREVPPGFSDAFDFIAAAVLLVRDPRDILYSQYSAVARHTTEGASGADIVKLRDLTAEITREAFVLDPHSIAFAQRIVECYRPMVEKGIRVLRYEDLFTDEGFSSDLLLRTVTEHLAPFLPDDFDPDAALAQLTLRIANSKALQGHATGGTYGMFRKLDAATTEQLNAALAPQLALLGYEQ